MTKRALIVDDSTSMRQMVGFTLRSAGYDVVEGIDGSDGLKKLEAGGHFHLIITDLNMPIMDGLTFIREARCLPAVRFTPILMLTTESSDERKMQGKAAGATGWMVKPFQPERLLKVLEKVVKV